MCGIHLQAATSIGSHEAHILCSAHNGKRLETCDLLQAFREFREEGRNERGSSARRLVALLPLAEHISVAGGTPALLWCLKEGMVDRKRLLVRARAHWAARK